MKINYVSHACLFVEAAGVKILTDPWFGPPSYLDQWHVHPAPKDETVLQRADVLLLSHGHQDHLHWPTLEHCNKNAKVYFPLQFEPGARKDFTELLGFRTFVEAIGRRTYQLPGSARVTFIPVGHDSIMVIEADGEVLVNVNDALHSTPAAVIDEVTAYVKRRFPAIDYMFCGYGGASHYPNCFKVEGKDDFAIACLRESLFARNFCIIANRLEPRVAVPFAADFVFKHDSLAWINDTRFDRNRMNALYRALFPKEDRSPTRIVTLLPGQSLDKGAVKGTPTQAAPGVRAPRLPSLPLGEVVKGYADLIRRNIGARAPFPFSVAVVAGKDVQYINAAEATVIVADRPLPNAAIECRIPRENADFLLEHPWHSDVIVIGYGMEFVVRDPAIIRRGGIQAIENIVTHYPNPRKSLRANPWRVLRYVATNFYTRFALRQRLGLATRGEFADVPRESWLTEKAGDMARRLGIPAEFERHGAGATAGSEPAMAKKPAYAET